MYSPALARTARRVTIGLLLFGTVSALVGAVLGIGRNGAGVPLDYLDGTPFTSYLIPGLILGVVVGGTQAAAAVALLLHRGAALQLTAVAGFGMTIWIFVELAIINEYSWLQTLYFSLGILELIGVITCLDTRPATAAAQPVRDQQLTT